MDLLEASPPAEIGTQPDFRRLIRHIDRARGTFSMVFVIWDSADTEDEVYDAIRARSSATSIERLPLTSADPADIFRQIEEAGSSRPDVVVVEGLYRSFPDRVRLSADDRPPILQVLNLYRERLRLHPVCLVLLLPEHALDLVARESPDFWSWRSGVFALQRRRSGVSPSTDATLFSAAGERDSDALLSRDQIDAEAARLSALWSSRFDDQITDRELPSAARVADRLVGLYRRQARFALAEDWRGRAINLLQRIVKGGYDPLVRAGTWINIGVLHRESPVGDRCENLRKAIAAYEEALSFYRRDAHPVEWALAQNNIGNAWADLPTGNRAENLRKALAAYEYALQVRTRDTFPVEWVATQNNIGKAWAELPTGERAGNVQRAIAALEAALSIRTRDAYPADWAMTQNNLGAAWTRLPTGERAGNVRKAIAAYQRALSFFTRDAHPVERAGTQSNIGTAWASIPTGDRDEDLRKAIAAYEAALSVYSPNADPIAWAGTQNNLGNAWATLSTGDRAENMRKAIAGYGDASSVYSRDAHPVDWAMTQNNIGNARAALPTGDRANNLRQAIAAYETALGVYTRNAYPVEWAKARHNCAVLLGYLADLPGEDRRGRLRHAIACGKGALSVFTLEAFPHEHVESMQALQTHRKTYESDGCAAGMPFDDIPAAA